jgi:hypothetical protein
MQPFYPEGHRTSPLDLPPIPTPTFNRSNRFNINAGFSQSSTCDQLPNRPDHGAVQITAQSRAEPKAKRRANDWSEPLVKTHQALWTAGTDTGFCPFARIRTTRDNTLYGEYTLRHSNDFDTVLPCT